MPRFEEVVVLPKDIVKVRKYKVLTCFWCRTKTTYIDELVYVPVCSEECSEAMWEQYAEQQEESDEDYST